MTHPVGIRQIVRGNALAPGLWQATCVDCGWEGFGRQLAADAQSDALEHQGGTRHVRERTLRKPPPAEQMDEMFPGAR